MWLDKVLYEWKVETGIRVRCYLTINYLKVRRELPVSGKGERLGEGNFSYKYLSQQILDFVSVSSTSDVYVLSESHHMDIKSIKISEQITLLCKHHSAGI